MPHNIITTYTTKTLGLLTALPLLVVTLGAMTVADEMLQNLRRDHAALVAAEADFRVQREVNGLAGDQASDYAAYVARLQRRVFEDCNAVLRSGSSLPDDLPCPVIIPPVTQSADIEAASEQTLEEQIAALDARLGAGLGEFDERLLQEQERIKAASPNNNSDGGGSGAGNGTQGGSQPPGGRATAGGEGDGRDAADRPVAETTTGGPGPGVAGSDRQEPADIPDGSDDDVVARQLREAAEKETDPELKAKLWEEYRKYKQGTH